MDPGDVVEPWHYVAPMADPVWNLFEFEPKTWGRADIFHKSIHWKEEEGMCTVEVHLEADVNGDGKFSFHSAGARFALGASSVSEMELSFAASVPERPGRRPSSNKSMLPR